MSALLRSLRGLALLVPLTLAACAAAAGADGQGGEPSDGGVDASDSVPTGDGGAVLPDAVAPTTPGLALSVHTTLGIPEAASVGDPVHALLVKPQFVVSFDSTRKNPRWTSWELTAAWLGPAARSTSWVADPALPAGMKQATNADYASSPLQRGHLCPSADRTATEADNKSTFVFTNAVPQTQASNLGPWADLEREERALAEAGHHVFVVAGSLYEGAARTMGDAVAVPSSTWKVVVVLDGAAPRPADVTAATRVITVNVPNTDTATGDYRAYRTSFATIEAKTGFTLLSDVPAEVHAALAVQVDPG